jgi:hypothetical protein
MFITEIKIMSVNAHRSNACMHALLQSDDSHILLIQEPWHYTVATLCSDTEPEGTPQKGLPSNNRWTAHLPRLRPNKTAKVAIYTKKTLIEGENFRILHQHPLTNRNSMVLDIINDNNTTLHLVNVYHQVPNWGHDLHALLSANVDDLIPTAILGDFNIHSPHWSLPNKPESSWGRQLTDWLDQQGLTCINTPDMPMWFDTSEHSTPSILDLTFVNEAVVFSGQIDDLQISEGPYPLMDHAALMLTYLPITSLKLVPPPAPRGYRVDPTKHKEWTATFTTSLRKTDQPKDLKTAIHHLDTAIETACKESLEPRCNPHLHGVPWWNDECTQAQAKTRATRPGPACKSATKILKQTILDTKWKWAHEKLHQAVDAQDIWSLAKLRKGRQTNMFPPLCDMDNMLVENPACKVQIFQDKFFPANLATVQTIQEDDPPPLPPCVWPAITLEEIAATLKTASDSSALGPSGIGYRLLKWAHAVEPTALSHVFNLSLFAGNHPWKHATVVILNKLNKPHYSLTKAYRPISLLECTAKLLEKIITKRVNADIISTNLVMLQAGRKVV